MGNGVIKDPCPNQFIDENTRDRWRYFRFKLNTETSSRVRGLAQLRKSLNIKEPRMLENDILTQMTRCADVSYGGMRV